MELKGTFKQEIFVSSDSLYKILDVNTLDGDIVVCGNFINLEPGLNYIFTGEYVNHPKYGKQFKADAYKRDNDSKSGLITFFSSSRFYGIGEKLATKIVDTLGLKAIDIILEDKEKLSLVKGISKDKREHIYEVLKSVNFEDKILLELYNYGLTSKMAKKLYEEYDNNVINIIQENPYRLIYEVDGYGFKKADELALSLNFSKDNPIRIKEAILYVLDDLCYRDGNIYIFKEDLIKKSTEYLGISSNKIDEELVNLANNKRIKLVNNKVYLINLYKAEFETAQKLLSLNKIEYTKYQNEDLKRELVNVEKEVGFTYTTRQKDTILNVLNDKISIITGGPGTGKTTIVKAIIKLYLKLSKQNKEDDILLLAPTGRAAKRLQESCNIPASTIHKALGYDYTGMFKYNADNLLPYKIIVIDESSMIDIELVHKLLSAIHLRTKIIFIGDENQLPSVGPGEFLHDIIASNVFKCYHLEEVMRQVSDSRIIRLANMVLHKHIYFDIFKDNKEIYLYNLTNIDLKWKIKQILDNYLAKGNSLNNIQILIPTYKGKDGIYEINNYIQENYNNTKDKSIKRGNFTFYINDRVLQLRNNPEKGIMNGDIGYIRDIFESEILVDFNNKAVKLDKTDLEDISLAYAVTVHKSQGSEYDYVIFPILSSYHIMLKRKLIYTAITRAKKKLIIFGDKYYINDRIKFKEGLKNTSLEEYLKGNVGLTPYDFL